MFEGIPLYEIQYNPGGSENDLAGVQLGNLNLASEEGLLYGQLFIKDCRFVLDGTSSVTQLVPVSAFAREHFFYVQSFSYWKAGAAHFTRRHNLDSFLLSYTYSGSGRLDYGGRSYTLHEGDAFLIDCRDLHTYQTSGTSWEHFVLHFSGVPAQRLYQDFTQENGYVFRPKAAAELSKRLDRLLKEYTRIGPYREYQVNAALTELLLAIMTTSDSYRQTREKLPPQLKDIVLYINGHYFQEISLDDLSSSYSISKYHLCRCFRQYTGYTINEYITQLQIEQAKELLRTTSLPAYQVGAAVGIADANYFYRFFKKNVGISPHKYRK